MLKLSNLSKAQVSQVLASIGNTYEPKLMGEAMRVQFSDLHRTESRHKESCGKGREPRKVRLCD